ncbi:MAG TPA: DUF1801 domain-containing protein [Prolixibacteraceae bacterium]|nr:DUF1801 domain-containing protein [Prolixibacteraceae bacterium]
MLFLTVFIPMGIIAIQNYPCLSWVLRRKKNFIALYHMGIYANPKLLNWVTDEFPKHSKLKLDMGKSCIRFKNVNQIPSELIGELVKKMEMTVWIHLYESNLIK